MSLVFAGICSHAPGITGRAGMADPALREPFYAAYHRLCEQLRAACQPGPICHFPSPLLFRLSQRCRNKIGGLRRTGANTGGW